MQRVTLSTERTKLVLPEPSQAALALEYFQANREHLRPTDPVLPLDFYTLDYWRKRLILSLDEYAHGLSVRFFIELKGQLNKFIGVVNFTQMARGPFQACYLGYSIAKDAEGKGLMSEALAEGIRYIFEDQHIHRVMANHLPENERSARVLKRLGFRIDGSTPDYLFINGAWRPHVLTSLTNSKWTPRPEDATLFSVPASAPETK